MFHVGNPSMFKDLAWDPIRDFSSVAMVAVSPHVIAVHPSVPARTLQELVDLAKKEPGKLNYASPGSGSVPHVGMELFKQQAGIDVMHVPYKGAGPMMQDVIAGQVQMTVATPPSLLGFVQTGRVRALAVAAKTRHPLMPDVPTTAEAGYPSFELEAWVALFAPAGTPRAVIEKLTAATSEALKAPRSRRARARHRHGDPLHAARRARCDREGRPRLLVERHSQREDHRGLTRARHRGAARLLH